MTDRTEKLSAENELLVQQTTRSYLFGSMAVFGIANLGIVLGGAFYLFFVLPQQALTQAVTFVQPEIEERLDEVLGRSEKRLRDIENQIDTAVGDAGELRGLTEALRDEAHDFRATLETAQTDLSAGLPSISEAGTFLKNFQETGAATFSEQLSALSTSVQALGSAPAPLRVLINEQDIEAKQIESTDYLTYWGPFTVDTHGGDVLVLFDVSFAGATTGAVRSWIRLLVNGNETRAVMTFSEQKWNLNSIVLNDVITGLEAGAHTIEIQGKVNSGRLVAPHRHIPSGDTATRKLIALEMAHES